MPAAPASSTTYWRSDLPFLELDLGWAWYAGADPLTLLVRARGRCPLVHVKDFYSREPGSFAPVGDGAIGYERIAPAAVAAGAEWLLVEQDETEGPPWRPRAARSKLSPRWSSRCLREIAA